jgi:hypothetical protein
MRTCRLLFLSAATAIVNLASSAYGESGHTDDWSFDASISIMIHRNGEPDACGSTTPINRDIVGRLSTANDKYEMESLLTDVLNGILVEEKTCASPDDELAPKSLHGFCDMGPDRTPILLDHDKLVKTEARTLPCRWYTREGMRISTINQLKELVDRATSAMSTAPSCANPQEGGSSCEENPVDDQGMQTSIHIYAVPAGRVFLFAPAYVGEIFHLDHLTLLPDPSKPIYMRVLSTSPKVFDLMNVFTTGEADEVVQRALKETSPSHKIKRSTTGTNENSIFNRRTSENGFDTHGTVALALKERIFEMLGFDEYWNGHDDGLQVLRYKYVVYLRDTCTLLDETLKLLIFHSSLCFFLQV